MSSLVEAFRRPPGARPWVFGHRGVRPDLPENTLKAFERARLEGADGVELDVRIDGSGEIIVAHDPTLIRVTAGTDRRHVEDLKTAEIKHIDLGGGERIPMLVEVLDWAAHFGMRVNVEVKSDVRARFSLLRRLAPVLKQATCPILLSSFNPLFVGWLARARPRLPVAWLVHAGQKILSRTPAFEQLGVSALHPEYVLATRERVQAWRARGVLVNVWTVNDLWAALELAEAGVDAIITDRPAAILQALNSPESTRRKLAEQPHH